MQYQNRLRSVDTQEGRDTQAREKKCKSKKKTKEKP